MQRMLAIADDLTGAAEIAGVGWRFGLDTRLVRETPAHCIDGLTVIDTDSRLLPPDRAANTVRQFVEPLAKLSFDLVYKKTDSVLRGPVRAEIEALLDVLDRRNALLLPQNPSRGRTIDGGIYRVDGVPLNQTSFKDDPDHPARSAVASEILGPSNRVVIGDARDGEEVMRCASKLAGDTLPAGGADFFTALLQQRGLHPSRPAVGALSSQTALFVCGSASAQSHQLIDAFVQRSLPVCRMPDDVFHGAPVEAWASTTAMALAQSRRALAIIGRPVDGAPGASQRLQQSLGELVQIVLSMQPVETLLLEGGATASAVCRRIGWSEFQISGELATGSVIMTIQSTSPQRIAVKPGSYSWPDSVWA